MSFAQSSLKHLIAAIDSNTAKLSIEKLYLQTDKDTYEAGDTLWFKGYLLNADDLAGSRKSGLVYIQILDEHHNIIRLEMAPVHTGSVWGNIALPGTLYRPGNYTLKAYTNWMLNDGDRDVYTKTFVVIDRDPNSWLINAKLNLSASALHANIGLKDLLQKPVILKDIDITLMRGDLVLQKKRSTTGVGGDLKIDLELSKDMDLRDVKLKLNSVSPENNKAYFIPVGLAKNGPVDLQFMPEGGALLNGQQSRIAFKAIAEDGKDVAVSGYIYDHLHQKITSFRTSHAGLGTVDLTPKYGETYTAEVLEADGTLSSYPLPKVAGSGVVVHVDDPFESDSLLVTICATPDLAARSEGYYLIGESRGVGCYGRLVKLDEQQTTVKLSKSIFPTGIAHITLLNSGYMPISERPVFIDARDLLHIDITANRSFYGRHDSVALNIKVVDQANKPVRGIFSMAVTNDARVPPGTGSLPAYMLLASELKGNIEDAAYYFQDKPTKERHDQLDNLILAQGWIAYPWKELFAQKKPVHQADRSFVVAGQVKNLLNKPVSGVKVILLSHRPFLTRDTLTDPAGAFSFNNLSPADTAAYFIQAVNNKNEPANVDISLQEPTPAVFSTAKEPLAFPYLNVDSSQIASIQRLASYSLQRDQLKGYKQLAEVKIRAKKIIKNSHNLNGPGQSDLALDEADMEKHPKATLGDIIRLYIKGLNKAKGLYYRITTETLHLIIDGTDVSKNRPDGYTPAELFEMYFDQFTAEDILGIEVMRGPTGKSMKYLHEYGSLQGGGDFSNEAYLEVTTRAGKGPFYKPTLGVYLYKPLPFDVPKTFYSPKYAVKNAVPIVDIRSTIFWEPNIITDSAGKATVRFNTSDEAGRYSLIIEGSNMVGELGSQRSKIDVK